VVNIKNKSHAVTAEVVVPEAGAEGVIIAQGGSIGGWNLYAYDGGGLGKGGEVRLFVDGET
jgi:arylsulfatase